MKYKFFINLVLIIINILNPFLYSYSNINNQNYLKNKNININMSLAPMLENILPTVVNIYTESIKSKNYYIPKEFKYFFNPEIPRNNKPFKGIGSGVIINSDKGYIITNYHVINGASKIKIKLNDGREFNAELIGNDDNTDIAVLKLINPKNLVEIKIANSDNLKIGDFVVAIGNPFGLGQTATSGIISALGRSGLSSNRLENFIQTDASINKGNSGGALVNIYGELIGINTAILAPSGGNIGIGFAIPSNIVKNLSYQIIKYGEVKRSQLGIRGTELTPDIAKIFKIDIRKGAFVNEVILGSAAYRYGIKSGDIIISINGKEINSFSELKVKIGIALPGENIQVGILRNGCIKNINIKLDDFFSSKIGKKISFSFFKGATFKNIRIKDNKNGVKVENVIENSPAYLMGLRKEDIIIGLNKNKISNLNELKKSLEKKPELIALNIIRKNIKMFLIFKK